MFAKEYDKDQWVRGAGGRRTLFALLLAAPFVLAGCLADDVAPDEGPDVTEPGDGNGDDDNGDPDRYSVGGNVSGLGSDAVVLALNEDVETLSVDADGDFQFNTELGDGSDYVVTIDLQPDGRSCDIDNGTGTIDGADVDDIAVDCAAALELSSISEPMQFHLSWSGADTIDLVYSSDPDCDWDNYSSCDDSDMLTGVSGGGETFEAIADGFDSDTGWYFVAEVGGMRSNQVGARPGPVSIGEDSHADAAHVADGTLYLGGEFKSIGMPTGKGAMLTPDSAELTGSVPVINRGGTPGLGRITAAVPDGEGGWFVAGEFDSVNDYERKNLVRIRADGSVDPDWHANTDSFVSAITKNDDRLYVGGDFVEIEHGGGIFGREHIAALDPETGAPDPDWNPGANDHVDALEAGESLVYAGGGFSQVGEDDLDRDRLAAFDPADGSVDTSWSAHVTDGSDINDLLLSSDTVYVGGNFSEIDGLAVENVAALDAVGGGVDTAWSGSVEGDHVGAFALEGDRLFVGGQFTEAGGEPRDNLAAFEAANGALVDDWSPNPNAQIHGMEVHDGLLYLIGRFDAFGADDVPRHHFAAVATDTGELDPDWVPNASMNMPLLDGLGDISVSDDVVYAGKSTIGIASHRTSLAAIDATSGIVDRDWQFELDGGVQVLESRGSNLYVGGWFDHVGETERNNLAAFSLDSVELDGDWDPAPDNRVHSLAVTENYLYAGGRFEEIGGESVAHLARLNYTDGEVDGDWDPEVDGSAFGTAVRSLLAHEGVLYAGGIFDEVDGDSQEGFAAIDVDTAGNDDAWPESSGTVLSMAVHDETLYVVGSFDGTDSIGGEDRDHLAAIDMSSGEVDDDWDPGVNGSTVRTVVAHDGKLVVGGIFQEIGGGSGGSYDYERSNLAAVGFVDGEVHPDWDPGTDQRVRALLGHDGNLFVAGNFNQAGGGSEDEPDHSFRPGLINIDIEDGELVW